MYPQIKKDKGMYTIVISDISEEFLQLKNMNFVD